MSPPAKETVAAQGLALRLWRHGALDVDGGPCALLLHGAMDTGRSFDEVCRLARTRKPELTLFAVDHRGHGQSDVVGAGASFHLLDFIKDTTVVIAALRARGFTLDALVGHSMGGNIAFSLMGALPDAARHVVLVDSVGAPPEEPEEQPARLAELLTSLSSPKRASLPVASVDEAIERVRRWNPGLSVEGARRMVEPVLVRGEDGLLRFPFDERLRGPTPVRHPEAQHLAGCDRVRAHGTRVTVIRAREGFVPAGDGDDVLGAPFLERARRLNANVVVVDGGHHVHVERPDVIAEVL